MKWDFNLTVRHRVHHHHRDLLKVITVVLFMEEEEEEGLCQTMGLIRSVDRDQDRVRDLKGHLDPADHRITSIRIIRFEEAEAVVVIIRGEIITETDHVIAG